MGHRALPPELYDGTSGIALFLHRLAQATGERIFHLTAEAALRQAHSKLPLPGGGLYAGGAGVLYVEFLMRGEVSARALVEQCRLNPNELDVISGSAGGIAALLATHRSLGCSCLLERAGRARGIAAPAGRAFRRRLELAGIWTEKPHRVFARDSRDRMGAARVASRQRRCALSDAALDAFGYERAHFDAERRNWPDFRERSSGFMNAWCHGAAGIGLSRVRAWELLQGEMLLSEALIALETVCEQLASMGNCSLCHGMLGNADILIYASDKLNRPDLLDAARQAGLQALERFENRRVPWPCGLPKANEVPDLMLGLAGMGHFYLHLANPGSPTPFCRCD